MNQYSHLAVLLASISSFGCLTVAIAKEQVSPDYENIAINTLQAKSKVLKVSTTKMASDNSDVSPISHKNAHQELNAIAKTSLVTAVLDGQLTTKTPPKTPSSSVEVSAPTVAIVKEAEGFRSSAYLDTDGTPVIGYGQSRIEGRKVRIGDRISPSAADAALKAELEFIQQEILSTVTVELNSNQLGALSSLAFNTGVYRVKKSTLVRKLNQEDYLGAANEFLRWDKANIRGQLVRMEGLTKRRHRERELFLTPVNPGTQSYPNKPPVFQPVS